MTRRRPGAVAFVLDVNSLKISASSAVAEIAGRALDICGIAGYRNDSRFALGGIWRDASGAALMVSNVRIAANSAQLLLIHRDG